MSARSSSFACLVVVASAAVATVAHAQAPVAATSAIPTCTSSLVLVRCDERHRVYLEDPAAATSAGNDLGRVVVTAPWQRRIRPEETLSRLGTQLQQRMDPQMAPAFAVGTVAPSGGLRDDRDNFGLSTECQLSGLPCANQPGRPWTTRFGN
ncbi:hypothetical protein BH09PSE6_BH09PSE6_10410 [soil metagenome]